MSRIKSGQSTRKRKKKIFKLTKGFWGKKKNCYRFAAEAVDRAGRFAYRDRRDKKGNFKKIWIIRISALAKQHGISYSKLVGGLKKAKIALDKKMLSELACSEPAAFLKIVELVKAS